MSNRYSKHRLFLSASVGLCAASTSFGTSTLNTLATFNNTNGASPSSALTLFAGILYGTTNSGGLNNVGTAYSVGVTGGGSPNPLVTFNNSNGASPYGALLISGNPFTLYGTTYNGGAGDYGTVFSAPINGGAPTTLATFNNTNGADPYAGLILSGSTLYGTTQYGGVYNSGTVFSVPITGGPITTLATFNTTNGRYPVARLILSGTTFYGTTQSGGANNSGTVFSLPMTGGSPTTLATFNTSNGRTPEGDLTLSGNLLYGTTQFGGAVNQGTIFSVPVGGGSPNTLANFNGSNGSQPVAGLVLADNTLYGTTYKGGASNRGTAFSLPVSGGAITTLATFNTSNGSYPQTGLTLSGSMLYGTTTGDGTNASAGTVFSLARTAIVVHSGIYQSLDYIPGNGSITVYTIAGISIEAGGRAVVSAVTNSASRQLTVISDPGLILGGSTNAWTGDLDLANNDLSLPDGSLADVTNQVAQGYNGGNNYAANGITSSTAGADSTHLTALGVIQNNQSGTAIFTASNHFDGTTPSANAILVKYTYYGDATLDGKVDGSDYTRIDNGVAAHGTLTGWFNGDFNYDGIVNGSDYTLIDNAFNTQGASLAAALATSTAQIAAVPEPSFTGLLGLASLGLVGRRKLIRGR